MVSFNSAVNFSIFLKLSIKSWSHIAHFLKLSFSFTFWLNFCSHWILSSYSNLICLSCSSIFCSFSFMVFSLSSRVAFNFFISFNFSLNLLPKSDKSTLFIFIISVKLLISTVAFSYLFIYSICCLFKSTISIFFSSISSQYLSFSEKINFTFINFASRSPFNFFNLVFSSKSSCILFWNFNTTSVDIFSITLLKFLFSLNNVSTFSWYNFLIAFKSGFFESAFNLLNSLSKTFFLSAKMIKSLILTERDRSLVLYLPLYME